MTLQSSKDKSLDKWSIMIEQPLNAGIGLKKDNCGLCDEFNLDDMPGQACVNKDGEACPIDDDDRCAVEFNRWFDALDNKDEETAKKYAIALYNRIKDIKVDEEV